MSDIIDEELVETNYATIEEETVGEGENAKKQICFKGILSEADTINGNHRVYPKSVLREVYQQALAKSKETGQPIFGELEHACFTYNNFSVLTKEGYKPFTELKVGEEVLTFNNDNVIEYNPIEKIIDEPYSGKVYHIYGRNIDTTVTPNHKFYLIDRYGKKQIATVKEIFENRVKYNHSRIIKNGGIWLGNGKDIVTIKGNEKQPEDLIVDAKLFFEFMGIYLSEGCTLVTQNNRIITITQKKAENIVKIRELLKNLNFVFSEYTSEDIYGEKTVQFAISDSRLKEYLKPLEHSWEKHIPEELKQYAPEYLNELIEWYIIGDGRDRRETDGYANVFSVSKKLMEDMNELLVKCGVSGNITEKPVIKDHYISDNNGEKRLIEAKNCRLLYQLNISTTNGIYLDARFLKIDEEDYNGNIYCLTVKNNSNFYIEDKNKFFLTGNSNGHINLERIAVTFPEFTWDEERGQILGKAVPTLTEAGKTVEGLAKSGMRICFSTRMAGKVKPMSEETKRRLNITEDCVEVMPGAKLISIDVVGNPSCYKAITDTVYEEKTITEEKHNPTFKQVFDSLL